MTTTTEVSHGRGGAGNMRADDTPYGDGEVVRAGVEGSHQDGAYSSGRGGAGNISDVGTTSTVRKDQDIIPDSAYRQSFNEEDHHTGRGGAGNEHHISHEKSVGEKARADGAIPVGLADKLKGKIFKAKK